MANDVDHLFSDKSVCVALVKEGLITKEQAIEIFEKKEKVRENIEKQKDARSSGVLSGVQITNPTTIPRSFAMKHLVLPIEVENGNFVIATSNHFNAEVFDDIGRVSLMPVKIVVTSKSDIIRFLIKD